MRSNRAPRVPGGPSGRAGGALLLGAALGMAVAAVAFAAPAASPSTIPAAGEHGRTAPAHSGSEVMARVNGNAILRRDFDMAVQVQFRGRRQAVGIKELQAVRDRVLERLIENELLYQKAVKKETPVPAKDVETELEKIKAGFPSAAVFASTLKDSGVDEAEFKDQVRRTLLVTRFVDREVVGDIKVTDEDVRRYYDQNPTEVNRQEAVHLAEILVRVAPGAAQNERAKAREKIEAILKELKSGADFADLARKYSDGPEARNGGDTGWLPRGKGPPAIMEIAFALQPGQTSDVVETRLGFHILKVLGKREAGPIPFDEAKERIRMRLVVREREARIRSYVDDLKEKAHIERGPGSTS
jgi:peptidyl-prolyl cis-trans isomerase C